MTCTILASDEGSYGMQLCIRLLESGRPALDAIEAGIKCVEDTHDARTVGFGGAPNILGQMELDASIMEGKTLQAGAVGALRGYKNPISVARQVMNRLPHVLLIGDGAKQFAREMGAEKRNMLSAQSKKEYQAWVKANIPLSARKNIKNADLAKLISASSRSNISRVVTGTVTFLAIDKAGDLCGGVSTSGWAYKYPGRLGDSPIIGAGLYVDNRYGGASCTHGGEMTIRLSTARQVVLAMKHGASVEAACAEAVKDLKQLRGGYIGPVIIHAMNKKGEPYVVSTGGDDGNCYFYWKSGMSSASKRYPHLPKERH